MTSEEKIESWIEKRNTYPDIIGVRECLAEHKLVLTQIQDDPSCLPEWIKLEEAVEEQYHIIKELEQIQDYAITHNIWQIL